MANRPQVRLISSGLQQLFESDTLFAHADLPFSVLSRVRIGESCEQSALTV